MADRDLAVIGSDRACHDSCRIALHHHPVGLFFVEHLADARKRTGGELVERLARRHQVEIVVGRHPCDIEHLVEHPAVLRRDADAAFEALVRLQGVDKWEKLDRFGPGAEDGEDFGARGHGAAL